MYEETEDICVSIRKWTELKVLKIGRSGLLKGRGDAAQNVSVRVCLYKDEGGRT